MPSAASTTDGSNQLVTSFVTCLDWVEGNKDFYNNFKEANIALYLENMLKILWFKIYSVCGPWDLHVRYELLAATSFLPSANKHLSIPPTLAVLVLSPLLQWLQPHFFSSHFTTLSEWMSGLLAFSPHKPMIKTWPGDPRDSPSLLLPRYGVITFCRCLIIP